MYISFFISRFIFSGKIETLIVYEWICYCLGNLIMYRVLMDLSLRRSTILTALFAYSLTVIFFEYAFYYFTFNNYFFMPLLLWTVIHTRNSKAKWFAPGIILAFSLLMGHAQYSCYHIMAYCIMQVVFSVQDKSWKSLLPMTASIFIFAGLSLFMLRQLVYGAETLGALRTNSYFFNEPISVGNIFDPLSTLFLSSNVSNFRYNVGMGIFAWLSLLILYPIYTKEMIPAIKNKLFLIGENLFAGKNNAYQRKIKYILEGNVILKNDAALDHSSKICTYGMTKNYSTIYGVFTLSGYDNIFPLKSFEQSNMIMSDIEYEVMYSGPGAIICS